MKFKTLFLAALGGLGAYLLIKPKITGADSPRISVSPASPVAGQLYTIQLSGFTPDSLITFSASSDAVLPGGIVTEAEGSGQVSDRPLYADTVTLTASDGVHTASVTFTILPAEAPPPEAVLVRIDNVEEMVRDPDSNYRGWLLDATLTNPNPYPVEKTYTVWAQRYTDMWSGERNTRITRTVSVPAYQSLGVQFDGSTKSDIYIRCTQIRFWLVDEAGVRSEYYIYIP